MELKMGSVKEASLIVCGQRRIVGRDNRRKKAMKKLILKLGILTNTSGQDLIEYALMAGFVAVAAGALMPGIATSISQIFSQVASVMTGAASQGS
jgi:pilus assembly protein Flp/PilA